LLRIPRAPSKGVRARVSADLVADHCRYALAEGFRFMRLLRYQLAGDV